VSFVLLLKLLLAPSLVAAASLAGRRFGQRIAGLTAALPIVGGPLLLFYAWDHGAAFVARAAEQALSGIFSLCAYCVAYAWLARSLRRHRWPWQLSALPISWGVFLASTGLFLLRVPSGSVAALLAAVGLGLGSRCLPHVDRPAAATERVSEPRRGLPYWAELGLRMLATALLVGTLSAVAGVLGPELSGLLTPFPVASTVLLVATHWVDGADEAIVLLRGFFSGMWGFAAFCAAIAWTALPLGPAAGFGLGLLGVALIQCAALRRDAARAP
jgi:hypothetical protein